MHGNKGKKQSREHKNKINTPQRAEKIRKTLLKLYAEGKKICWTKGKKLSKKHRENIKKSCKYGKNNHTWSGNKLSYSAAHLWINKYFGRANQCENRKKKILDFDCSKRSNNFQWAKKKGRRYSRKLEDYFQLCVSCHSKFDYNHKNKICSLKGCKRKHKGHNFCDKHYQRLKKWGDPLVVKAHHNHIKYVI